jgi:hypothetical protein
MHISVNDDDQVRRVLLFWQTRRLAVLCVNLKKRWSEVEISICYTGQHRNGSEVIELTLEADLNDAGVPAWEMTLKPETLREVALMANSEFLLKHHKNAVHCHMIPKLLPSMEPVFLYKKVESPT